jgi:hypothetical protein
MLCASATFVSAQTRPVARPVTAPAPSLDASRSILQVEEMAATGDITIFGDAAKPGMYLLRKRIAANQTVRPHYDDQDRWVTVLKGTLWLGKGDVFKPDSLVPIREGGVAYLPANTHYFEMAGESETLIQVSGSGPVKSTHTELDAKGQPVPVNGPYPVITAGRRRNMPVDPDLLDADQIDQMERAAAAKKEAEAKKAASPTK